MTFNISHYLQINNYIIKKYKLLNEDCFNFAYSICNSKFYI